MGYKIINKVSSKYVPKWGNTHQYIAIHYLGVDGQNYELASDGTGAHYTIYWDGTIYQRCSHDAIVWAVGTAGVYTQKHPYARNANTISIEMCCHCDGNKQSAEDPKWYFTKETQEACVWLVKKLMKELNVPADHVLRHYDIVSKTCPAPYVHNNGYKGTWTWNQFLARITEDLPILYRVRASWDDAKSQTGAYEDLQNAKDDADDHPGYSVYDQNGKAIYTSVTRGTQAKSLNGLSESDKVKKIAPLYQAVAKDTGMLASVGLAQFCLESFFGTTDLAQEANNLHGMKCSLSNNTWPNSTWNGKSKYGKVTKEQDKDGNEYKEYAYFRKYPCIEDSIRDRAAYFLGAMNGTKKRYPGIGNLKTAEEQIKAIKAGGYATDVKYVDKLMNLVQRFNLTQYDQPVEWYRVAESFKNGKYIGQIGAYEKKDGAIARAKERGLCAFDPAGKQIYPEPSTALTDRYVVRRRWSEEKYQLGKFHDLKNAKRLAKATWGYRVYDLENPGKAIYTPRLTRAQKLCAAFVRLNQWLVDDIADGVDWRYYNSKYISESTFWKTRKAHKYYTNCMGGVAFAMKESGLPASACSWYGQKGGGIRFLNDHAMADLLKYADLIKIGNKTPAQLEAAGMLCPGDILTFVALNHTCGYLGNGLSYDSGHAYCIENGEGAHFVKWIGPLSWANYKVGYIIRMR